METGDLVINIHRAVSTMFVIMAVILIVRAAKGLKKNRPYTKTDRRIAVLVLLLLYVQLFAGLILYFALGNLREGASSIEEARRIMSIRFWALEHFIIMMFALFLSQLGWIFIVKSGLDSTKHKNALLYFGISFLIIIIPTGLALVWR